MMEQNNIVVDDVKIPTIGFVILTWNSENYISECLDSLLKIRNYKIYISIFDNESTDNTKAILDSYATKENFFIKKNDKNLGTTISRNQALKQLPKTDYIVILDSDTIISDYSGLDKAIEILNNDETIGIIGPKLIDDKGVMQYSGRNIPTIKEKFLKAITHKNGKKISNLEHVDYEEKGDLFCVGYLMSAAWIMRRDFFEKNGYLDEKIFYAPEDVEYCVRAWINGYKVCYYKKFFIIHYWQRISKKKFFSKHNFEHIKGLIYFFHKYNKKTLNMIKMKVENDG